MQRQRTRASRIVGGIVIAAVFGYVFWVSATGVLGICLAASPAQQDPAAAYCRDSGWIYAWDSEGNGPAHVRSSNKNLVYELRPNTVLKPCFTTNSFGFRDVEFALEKPSGTFRILVIGDALTFGRWIAPEETYPKILEALLNRTSGSTRYEVWNLAVEGYDAAQELALLRSIVFRFHPDMVIVGCNADDSRRASDDGQWRHFRQTDSSWFANLLAIQFDIQRVLWGIVSGRPCVVRRLEEMRSVLGGTPLRVVFFPPAPGANRLDYAAFKQAVQAIDSTQGFQSLNLENAFQGWELSAFFHEDGIHPKALWHALSALTIATALPNTENGVENTHVSLLPCEAIAALKSGDLERAVSALDRLCAHAPEKRSFAGEILALRIFPDDQADSSLKARLAACAFASGIYTDAATLRRLIRNAADQTVPLVSFVRSMRSYAALSQGRDGPLNVLADLAHEFEQEGNTIAAQWAYVCTLAFGRGGWPVFDATEALDRLLRTQGHPEERATVWQAVVERFPDFAPVYAYCIEALHAIGRQPDDDILSRWAGIRDEVVRNWIDRGNASLGTGFPADALKYYREAMAADPENEDTAGLFDRLLAEEYPSERIAAWQNAAQRSPNAAGPMARLAEALHDAGHWEAALDAYAESVRRNPSRQARIKDGLMELGEAAMQHDHMEIAANAFERAAEIAPDDAGVLLRFSAALEKQDKKERAIQVLQQALTLLPHDAEIQRRLGNLQIAAGDRETGLRTLLQAGSAEALSDAGRALEEQEDWPGAESAYRRTLEADPENATAWHRLGVALSRQDRLEEALDAVNRALALAPSDRPSRLTLADVLSRKGDIPAARNLLEALAAEDGRQPDIWLVLAEVRRRGRDLQGAVEAYQRALEHDPEHPGVLAGLALVYEGLGDWENLASVCERIIKHKKDDPLAYERLGATFGQLGKVEEARAAFRKARELAPERPGAWIGEARMLSENNRENEAAALCREFIEKQPDNAEAWLLLSDILASNESFDEALAALARAETIQPGNPASHAKKGLILVKKQDWARAAEAFQKAADLQPGNVETLAYLGESLRRGGRFDEAAAVFDKALAIAPGHAQCLNGAILTAQNQKRWDHVETLCRNTLEHYPENVFAQSMLVEALRQQGKWPEALVLLQQTLEKKADSRILLETAAQLVAEHPATPESKAISLIITGKKPYDAIAWSLLGIVRRAEGNTDEAIGLFRKALGFDPRCIEALMGMAEILDEHGDKAGALAAYEKAAAVNPKHETAARRIAELRAEGVVPAD